MIFLSNKSQLLFCLDNSLSGITNGSFNLEAGIRSVGSCTGTQGGNYICGGVGKYITWSIDVARSDFEIRSEFKVDKVAGTAISFVLWAGNTQYHIGLDGSSCGHCLFYSSYNGGTWGTGNLLGTTNLVHNVYQTIVITRSGNSFLNIVLGRKAWQAISFSDSITAISWRPHRNTIRIKNLVLEIRSNYEILNDYDCICLTLKKCDL